MDILHIISTQMRAMSLPLYAVTLTAVPRSDTPLLLMMHWHGFRKESLPNFRWMPPKIQPVPGSALQLNDRWQRPETLDSAVLDAAWQLGAWDVQREEHRGCRQFGVSPQEARECMQAFGEYQVERQDDLLVSEAPDREEMLDLGARVGYIQWKFRPVCGGIWDTTADDDTLGENGRREPPCPIAPVGLKGGNLSTVLYRLGKVSRIIIP